jgi:uncharacterized membrane protein YgdD (TMEM256/DUF423 family)
MDRTFFLIGSLAAGLAVALGAFGAHALSERLTEDMLATFEIGVRYNFYHALALLAVAFAIGRWPGSGAAVWAGWLFVGGIVIFSGSLYVLTLTGARWLGAVTPIGGVLLIAGWLCLAWAAYSGR